jgi:competence protein ComEC
MWFRALEDEARRARPGAARQRAFDASHLELRMFSVGEGEAILLIFPGGRTWLVDGGTTNRPGPNDDLARVLIRYLEGRGLRLEACVASHPHIDHVGSLATILISPSPAIAPKVTVYRTGVAWTGTADWLKRYHAALAGPGPAVEDVAIAGVHREIPIADSVSAHLFSGSGAGPYTALFMQLRFRSARLLFTGDCECAYEVKLLEAFGETDFRADLLKVTHHGSSSGTSARVLRAIKPALAIASTADDDGHRLEADTIERLQGDGRKLYYFETLAGGDIVVLTDGEPYLGGVLYRVELVDPPRFANELGAVVIPCEEIERGRGDDTHCD